MKPISLFAMMALALAAEASAQTPQKAAVTNSAPVTVALSPQFAKTSLPDKVTVLQTQKLGDGVYSRIVRDCRGRIYRTLLENGKEYGGAETLAGNPRYLSGDYSFYESFEAYDLGNAWAEWLPEGWTEINTPASTPTEESIANYYNNSWKGGYTGDGYWTAVTTDGEKECFIHFTYNVWNYNDEGMPDGYKFKAEPQDEWLITPEFQVKEGHNLMFLCEFDLSSIYNYSYYTYTYDRSKIDCDLEVLVSDPEGDVTDANGGTWTTLYKVSRDYAADKTDEELRANPSKMKYYDVFLPLTGYYGKNIKLAFRYLNATEETMVGNSMAVDAVTVDAAPALTSYELPEGTLMAGFTEDLYTPNQSFALVAPYARQTWEANSNSYTFNNKWEFWDHQSQALQAVAEGSDPNLKYEVVYPCSNGEAVPYPVLTASNDMTSFAFSYDNQEEGEGGNGGIYYDTNMPQIMGRDLYVGNFDYVHKHLRIPDFGPDEYLYGMPVGYDTWGDYIQVGFGNSFPATGKNFEVSKVCFTLGKYDADADAQFTMEIHEMDEANDQVDPTPVYTTTISGSSVVNNDGIYQAVFPITDTNGNSATFNYGEKKIVIFVKGYAENDKVRMFAGCDQAINNQLDRKYNNAWLMLSKDDEISYWNAVDALRNYSNTVYVSLLGKYNYIGSMEDEVVLYADIDTREVAMESDTQDAAQWKVSFGTSDVLNSLPATNDWLTVSLRPGENGRHTAVFTGAAPAQEREQNVTFHSRNASYTVKVSQTAQSGVEITGTDSMQVIVEKDRIVINGAGSGENVKVFNISGQTVALAETGIDGRATISHALPAGIYIVRVGNRAYKVIF